MRRVYLKDRVKIEAAKIAAGALVIICLIFGGIMPAVLSAVLRTVAVMLALYYCVKSGEVMVQALIEVIQQPRRRHVIVDLKRGTIKET